MFAFRDTRGPVDIAFTDRHGGVSGGPYASLNLGGSSDDQDAVRQNLHIVTRAFSQGSPGAPTGEVGTERSAESPDRSSPRLVLMRQVQGSDVALVGPDQPLEPERRVAVTADALITPEPEAVLMVRAADCVPILVADVERGVAGAVHAGRPGMVAGVVPNAVRAMRAIGADRLVAWIGPHVCGRCYEVPDDMRAEVSASVPESYAQTSWGTPALDIGAGVRAQLAREGVELVAEVSRCTLEDEDLFSYRRQGKESGRLAGMVWVRA